MRQVVTSKEVYWQSYRNFLLFQPLDIMEGLSSFGFLCMLKHYTNLENTIFNF